MEDSACLTIASFRCGCRAAEFCLIILTAEYVVLDYLEVFREIMREPRWKDQFDLVAHVTFDPLGKRLIEAPCSALNWEHIHKCISMALSWA